MIVRDAAEEDLPAILAIFNDVIVTSTAVYMDHPTTLDERAEAPEDSRAAHGR